MNYKLIKPVNINLDVITQILCNRGIAENEISHYLNTTENDIYDTRLLDNIDIGVKMLLDCIENKKKIHIIPDVDVDGFTSAAILINYIYCMDNDYAKEFITFEINDEKIHGIRLETIPSDISLLVCPDSSSNDYEQHKILKEKGIQVLVLDHHDADKISENACIINNQLCDYPNKSLSGAGIVYKFCCRIDEVKNTHYTERFLDLVAVGLVGDMVSLRDFETKHFVQQGIRKINNPFLKCILDKNKFFVGTELTPKGIAFSVAPQINATIRMGSKSEKRTLFESMLDFMAYIQVPSTKRGCKGQTETRVEQACRNCTNIKNRQTRARDASLELVESQIKDKNLLQNKIITVTVGNDFNKNLSGLIANELVAKYQHPVLILRDVGNEWSGSARGCNGSDLEDFKGFVSSTGLPSLAQGHPNAFGFAIEKDKLDSFINKSNEELKSCNFNPCYKVDFIYNNFDFKSSDIIKIAELDSIYGQDMEKPYIAIGNISVTKENLILMSPDKKPTLKIKLQNGCDLIKFKSSEEEYESLISKTGCVKINVVGRCNQNIWMGRTTAQITVEDYEIMGETYYF